MKSNAVITHFTRTGLGFSDGSEIPADVIVFCTGFVGNMRTDVARIFGKDVAARADDFWGLDEEGELRGAFKRNSRTFFNFSYHSILAPARPPSFQRFLVLVFVIIRELMLIDFFGLGRSQPLDARWHDRSLQTFLQVYRLAD